MLIDIHTHVFPDKIAARAIESMMLGITRNYEHHKVTITPSADGTVSDLIRTMDESGCTHSVLCPVVTNPKSTEKTNAFSLAQKSERLIPFAGLIPTDENAYAILENIAESGFKGIKLHPEFQDFDVDDEKIIQFIKRAEEFGLIIIFHAGKDPGFPPPAHSAPEKMARMLDRVDGRKIVAAHMGGFWEWEEVKKYLLDSPIYFDTACIAKFMDKELCRDIIRAHGADKILFGSDYPWTTSGETLEYVKALGLNEEELERITFKNAKKLLNI